MSEESERFAQILADRRAHKERMGKVLPQDYATIDEYELAQPRNEPLQERANRR